MIFTGTANLVIVGLEISQVMGIIFTKVGTATGNHF